MLLLWLSIFHYSGLTHASDVNLNESLNYYTGGFVGSYVPLIKSRVDYLITTSELTDSLTNQEFQYNSGFWFMFQLGVKVLNNSLGTVALGLSSTYQSFTKMATRDQVFQGSFKNTKLYSIETTTVDCLLEVLERYFLQTGFYLGMRLGVEYKNHVVTFKADTVFKLNPQFIFVIGPVLGYEVETGISQLQVAVDTSVLYLPAHVFELPLYHYRYNQEINFEQYFDASYQFRIHAGLVYYW
jgi:hypothetical protein